MGKGGVWDGMGWDGMGWDGESLNLLYFTSIL